MKTKDIKVTNPTDAQREWIEAESKRLGIGIGAVIKNWINGEIHKKINRRTK